jgi:hypothetical protein
MDFITKYNNTAFSRTTTVLTKENVLPYLNYSGSLDTMGGGFILLGARFIGGNAPAVLRLYSDEASMITDQSRLPGNYNLNDSVALITEINFENLSPINFDPPVIGNTFNSGRVWYNLSASSQASIELQSYPIREIGDSTNGNQTLTITQSSVPTTGVISGSIITPKSFLILTGSATRQSRLRLYSRPYTEIPAEETTRPFTSQSNSGSLLIADLVFDSASFNYPLVPILEGYTWLSNQYEVGSNQVGYYLENISGVVGNITISLSVYSTED